ncbi:serine aminopeptidase domain-containing protein [Serratia sp. DD3]|uniref:alpha/beta hydrolase family protein n=1 Tax=Serratia sp. DD3 TaxID=1410619 RepID=UPI0003C50E01|nr:alpha/beta hydrolase [Serratia sp. DD3]KEY60638.1 extracellular lipase, Pla-1/cef family [Serratia sp. DD3]
MKIVALLWVFFCTTAIASDWQVGSRIQIFHNEERQLVSRIYYPTSSHEKRQKISNNPVFVSSEAQLNAPPAAGPFPLVILSHGSGGNKESLSWLAYALVQRGIIVIATDHPGSTTGNSVPAQSIRLWEQTRDISALLDDVLVDPTWQPRISSQAIGVIGHSKGGYTAIALLGGRVSLRDFSAGCQQQPDSPNCIFYKGVHLEQVPATKFDADYRDNRIQFAVALDPGMVPYLQPSSLKTLSAPLLIVAVQHYIPGNQGANLQGNMLAAYQGKYPIIATQLAGANHFDFLPLCKPTATALLAEEGEAYICGSLMAQRQKIHHQTIKHILKFIAPWLKHARA